MDFQNEKARVFPERKEVKNMDTQTLILIVIGVVLLVALVLLFGSGMAMGGMAMMAGMMGTPVGWVILLVILAVAALVGYMAFYA